MTPKNTSDTAPELATAPIETPAEAPAETPPAAPLREWVVQAEMLRVKPVIAYRGGIIRLTDERAAEALARIPDCIAPLL